jgi:hypothetical protein
VTSAAQTCDGRFIEASWGFHGIPINSRVFFLPPKCSSRLRGILGAEVDDAQDDSWRGSFAKRLWQLCLPTWGVDVDGLAYPLHRPTSCSCQVRG